MEDVILIIIMFLHRYVYQMYTDPWYSSLFLIGKLMTLLTLW